MFPAVIPFISRVVSFGGSKLVKPAVSFDHPAKYAFCPLNSNVFWGWLSYLCGLCFFFRFGGVVEGSYYVML